MFHGEPLIDATSGVVIACFSCVLLYDLFLSRSVSLPLAAHRLSQLLAVLLATNVAVKAGAAGTVEAVSAEVDHKSGELALKRLRVRLVSAGSDNAILRLGASALGELFPGTAAVALGCFVPSEGSEAAPLQLAALRVSSHHSRARAALEAALPSRQSGRQRSCALGPHTSVVRACAAHAQAALLDSRDSPEGLAACSDWAAALDAGLDSSAAVTSSLRAGHVTVGFVTLHFPAQAHRRSPAAKLALLTQFSDALGGALFVRRALALALDRSLASGLVRQPRARDGSRDSAAPLRLVRRSTLQLPSSFPASEADVEALEALDASAAQDELLLASWTLDAWALPDQELHRLFQAHLHAFGLLRRFHLSPTALSAFSSDVAARMEGAANPFHNWRHVFMVFHTAWLFLFHDRGLRDQLAELDVLALLLSAVCHDLEHPGTTNAFQINSGSQLAMRYNDTSVLENHHASSAFAALERCALLEAMEASDYTSLRKTMVAAILCTDMASHKALHARVVKACEQMTDGQEEGVDPEEQGIDFSRDPEDRNLLVSYLLHCADLCCPLFPPPMSRRVSEALSREFDAQAAMERAAALPVSVPVGDTAAAKAKLEVGFIQFVVQPLYVTLQRITPTVGTHCLQLMDANRAMWAQVIQEAC